MGPRKPKEFIFFAPTGKELTFVPGDTVLDVAEYHRLGLAHSCGGMGSCGTCRVIILGDLSALPERSPLEQEMAEDRGFQPCERLACQIEAIPGLRFKSPDDE